MQKFRETLKKKEGFTLIELLLVVAILGVIAALAIPRIGESLKDSRIKTCRQQMKMIRNQLELYKQKVLGQYPADSTAFTNFIADRTWFERIPKDPDDQTYTYARVVGPPEDFSVTCPDIKAEGHNF